MEDYTRALKAAKKAGWKEVNVKFPNGYEVTLREGEALAQPAVEEQPKKPKLHW